jgi:hypothetical protein
VRATLRRFMKSTLVLSGTSLSSFMDLRSVRY